MLYNSFIVMKSLIKKILLLCFFIGIAISLSGQCVPDTANCKDTDDPGQVCPDTLPAATLGEDYEQVFTIIPPDKFDFGSGVIEIFKIVIDSVSNLPPGLSYEVNATDMYPDSAYCGLISGTPTETGTFFLEIYIRPFVYFAGDTIALDQTKDSTSLSITVNSSSGIFPSVNNQPTLIPSKPNPFKTRSSIGLNAYEDGMGELYVYYLTGELVHYEEKLMQPGTNYFNFKGEKLKKGIYIYRIRYKDKSFTSRVVKM